jgi:hypothetical protein
MPESNRDTSRAEDAIKLVRHLSSRKAVRNIMLDS